MVYDKLHKNEPLQCFVTILPVYYPEFYPSGPGKNTAKTALGAIINPALRCRLYRATKMASLRDCSRFSNQKSTHCNTYQPITFAR